MSLASEAAAAPKALQAALEAGIESISYEQAIVFTQYSRQVLPLDGWIFWLNTGVTQTVKGSLHYAINLEQNEDETVGKNHVIFTTQTQIQDMDLASPSTLFLGTIDEIRFSFKSIKNLYQESGTFHYQGDAVYPAMASQIVDNPLNLDLTNVVVSNSLPLWIAIPSTTVFGMNTPTYPIYPSFLIPQDLVPPYIAAHVIPDSTNALQSAPAFDYKGDHSQLTKDKVRLTFYGLRNNDILDFQDYIFQYSLNTDNIGIMNMPIVRDDKRTQPEMGVLGIKKTMDFEISYYQNRINNVSRQMITSTAQNYSPHP